MDLSKLSTDDLMALRAGDLSRVSTQGLQALHGQAALGPERRKAGGAGDLLAGAVRGAGSIGATLLTPVDALVRATGADNEWVGPQGTLLGRTDRRQAMTDALGELGADTNSYAFGTGKIGAEVAGTLGVGGGLGRVAQAAGAAPRLVQALTTSGLSTGAPATRGALPWLAELALRSGAGSTTGAASAALVDPESAGSGAAIGAALPPALRGIGAAARTAGKVTTGVRAALSDAGAQRAALQRIESEAGPAAAQISSAVAGRPSPAAGQIPLSAAALGGSRDLALLEQASRLRNPAVWNEFDQRQAAAVWDKVRSATAGADDLVALRAARGRNWDANWQKAIGEFADARDPGRWLSGMTNWGQRVAGLRQNLDAALTTPEASNPAVRQMVQGLAAEMDRLGADLTPGHLQQLRANFNARYVPGDPNVFRAAPRDAAATRSIIQELDDILNSATGGKWDAVRAGYASDTQAVRAAQAAGKVRAAFMDAETGRIIGTAADTAGDIPRITEAGLGRALNAARLPDKSSALAPGSLSQLEQVLASLRAQQVVQQVKRSAAAGGGSDTASNLLSLVNTQAPSTGLLSELARLVRQVSTGRTDAQLAGLLSDPEALAALVAKTPNSDLLGRIVDQGQLFGVRAAPSAAASR